MLEMNRPQQIDYQFICHYKDGDKMYQNYGTEEEKHFGDIDLDRLEVFEITNGIRSYKLNIDTGVFDLNGVICDFDLGYLDKEHLDPDSFRLIYFRRIQQQFGAKQGIKSVRHAFGWQCTIDNENYQRIVFINSDGSLTFVNKK